MVASNSTDLSQAGPTMLKALEEETAAVVGYETSLTCQMECSPLCGLEWLVDGQLVDDEKYTVEEEIVQEEKEINQFTGVKSTLTWHQLERTDEEISITCRLSGHFLKRYFSTFRLNFPGQLLVQLKRMPRRKMQLWRAQLSSGWNVSDGSS